MSLELSVFVLSLELSVHVFCTAPRSLTHLGSFNFDLVWNALTKHTGLYCVWNFVSLSGVKQLRCVQLVFRTVLAVTTDLWRCAAVHLTRELTV